MFSVMLFQRDINGLIPIIYLTFYQDMDEIIETQHLNTHALAAQNTSLSNMHIHNNASH